MLEFTSGNIHASATTPRRMQATVYSAVGRPPFMQKRWQQVIVEFVRNITKNNIIGN